MTSKNAEQEEPYVVRKRLAGRIKDELSTKYALDKNDGWKYDGRAISPVEKMR